MVSSVHKNGWRLPHWLMVAALIIVFDQGSKAWAMETLSTGEPWVLTPFLNFILVFNRGAAFSFLADAEGWQRWFFTLLALAVTAWIIYTIRRHPAENTMNLALSMIMGGALGNVVDRLRLGAVIDFVDVHAAGWHWPAFNLADSAITVGAMLLIWDQFRPRTAGNDREPQ